MGPLRHLAEWRSSSSWADRPAGNDTREWRDVQVPIQETAWKRGYVSGTEDHKPTLLTSLRPWTLPSISTHATVRSSMLVHTCILHLMPNDPGICAPHMWSPTVKGHRPAAPLRR